MAVHTESLLRELRNEGLPMVAESLCGVLSKLLTHSSQRVSRRLSVTHIGRGLESHILDSSSDQGVG